jgi:multiple sugar transport system substrate-binding protein
MKVKKRMKLGALLLTTTALLTALTGCGGQEAAKGSDADAGKDAAAVEKPVTIKLWSYPKWSGIKGDEPNGQIGDWETDAVKRFMAKHPHVKVETEYLNPKGGPEKVAIAIQTNEVADVIMDTNNRLFEYARQGLLEPMDDKLDAALVADLHESIWENAKLDGGKRFYLPWHLTPQVLLVNKTLFKKAGADHLLPKGEDRTWTFDEYYQAVKGVAEKLPGTYGVGLFGNTVTADSFMLHWFWSHGARTFDQANTKVTLNSEKGLQAMNFLKKLVDEKIAQPGAAGVGYSDVATLFNQQKVASMSIATSGYARVIKGQQDKQIEPFEMEIVNMPSITKGEKPVSFLHEYGISVFKNSDPNITKWSFELVKFLANEENAGAVKAGLGYSPRKSQSNLYAANDDPNLKFAEKTLQYAIDGGVSVPGFNQQRTMFGSKLQAFLTNTKSAEAALKEFEAEGNKIITEARNNAK